MSKYIYKTDKGLKREINEDSGFAKEVTIPGIPFSHVLVIADGMGGLNAGEIASGLAVKIIEDFFVLGGYKDFARDYALDIRDINTVLKESFLYIHKQIRIRAQSLSPLKNMGTTCIVALILKNNTNNKKVIIGHVGDSRAYKISQNSIKLITEDDSLVWQYYKRGMIGYHEINTHPERNILIQALGGESFENPHITNLILNKNESLVLCSDGLHGMINDNLIHKISVQSKNLEDFSGKLITAANNAGGKDNISIAVYSEIDRQVAFRKRQTKILFLRTPVILLIFAFLTLAFISIIVFKNRSSEQNELISEAWEKNEQKITSSLSEKPFLFDAISDKDLYKEGEKIIFKINPSDKNTIDTLLYSYWCEIEDSLAEDKKSHLLSNTWQITYEPKRTGNLSLNFTINVMSKDAHISIIKSNTLRKLVLVKKKELIYPSIEVKLMRQKGTKIPILNIETKGDQKLIEKIIWPKPNSIRAKEGKFKVIYNKKTELPSTLEIKFIDGSIRKYKIIKLNGNE